MLRTNWSITSVLSLNGIRKNGRMESDLPALSIRTFSAGLSSSLVWVSFEASPISAVIRLFVCFTAFSFSSFETLWRNRSFENWLKWWTMLSRVFHGIASSMPELFTWSLDALFVGRLLDCPAWSLDWTVGCLLLVSFSLFSPGALVSEDPRVSILNGFISNSAGQTVQNPKDWNSIFSVFKGFEYWNESENIRQLWTRFLFTDLFGEVHTGIIPVVCTHDNYIVAGI